MWWKIHVRTIISFGFPFAIQPDEENNLFNFRGKFRSRFDGYFSIDTFAASEAYAARSKCDVFGFQRRGRRCAELNEDGV